MNISTHLYFLPEGVLVFCTKSFTSLIKSSSLFYFDATQNGIGFSASLYTILLVVTGFCALTFLRVRLIRGFLRSLDERAKGI